MPSTRSIHRLKPLALVVTFAALASPALADPPQLQNAARAHLVAPDGWAAQYADHRTIAARLGAPDGYTPARLGYPDGWAARLGYPDGWAVQYVKSGSGAAGHPDNLPRFIGPGQANGAASDSGDGVGWRAGLIGMLAFGLALATVGTLVLRTRTRVVRA